jgi:hypothetical protein
VLKDRILTRSKFCESLKIKITFFFILVILPFINFAQNLKWQMYETDFTNDLYGIFFTDSLTGYICGEGGLILKTTDGINWVSKPTPTTNTLRDIVFIRDTLGWACGDSGTIIHTMNGGESWELQVTSCTRQLVSIDFYDYESGFTGRAAGDSVRLILYFNDNMWLGCINLIGCNYHFVNFFDFWALFMCSNEFWITGDNGTTWGYIGPFEADMFKSTQRINYNVGTWNYNFWMVGEDGIAYSFLEPIIGWPYFKATNYNTSNLFGISVDEYSHKLWAVGLNGTILISLDEGLSYDLYESPTNETLNDVVFSGFNTGFAIGSNGTILYYHDSWEVSTNKIQINPDLMLFPNPFRDKLAFTYTGINGERFKIEIYNQHGNLVFQRENLVGQYIWNAIDNNGFRIKKGVYIIKIISPNNIDVIKIINN